MICLCPWGSPLRHQVTIGLKIGGSFGTPYSADVMGEFYTRVKDSQKGSWPDVKEKAGNLSYSFKNKVNKLGMWLDQIKWDQLPLAPGYSK